MHTIPWCTTLCDCFQLWSLVWIAYHCVPWYTTLFPLWPLVCTMQQRHTARYKQIVCLRSQKSPTPHFHIQTCRHAGMQCLIKSHYTRHVSVVRVANIARSQVSRTPTWRSADESTEAREGFAKCFGLIWYGGIWHRVACILLGYHLVNIRFNSSKRSFCVPTHVLRPWPHMETEEAFYAKVSQHPGARLI